MAVPPPPGYVGQELARHSRPIMHTLILYYCRRAFVHTKKVGSNSHTLIIHHDQSSSLSFHIGQSRFDLRFRQVIVRDKFILIYNFNYSVLRVSKLYTNTTCLAIFTNTLCLQQYNNLCHALAFADRIKCARF